MDKKSKKIIIIISVLFAFFCITMIILAIATNLNKKDHSEDGTLTSYVDPISGETITSVKGVGLKYDDIEFVGEYRLLDRGVTSDMLKDIRDLFRVRRKQLNIEKVSLYKNSFKHTGERGVSTAKFTINQGQKDVYLKIVRKNFLEYNLYLYEDEALTKEIK